MLYSQIERLCERLRLIVVLTVHEIHLIVMFLLNERKIILIQNLVIAKNITIIYGDEVMIITKLTDDMILKHI